MILEIAAPFFSQLCFKFLIALSLIILSDLRSYKYSNYFHNQCMSKRIPMIGYFLRNSKMKREQFIRVAQTVDIGASDNSTPGIGPRSS
jgi:hypothetical protein